MFFQLSKIYHTIPLVPVGIWYKHQLSQLNCPNATCTNIPKSVRTRPGRRYSLNVAYFIFQNIGIYWFSLLYFTLNTLV